MTLVGKFLSLCQIHRCNQLECLAECHGRQVHNTPE
jgi:hypothetical protein